MRILRVAHKVYPEIDGGGPYHVHAMSRDQATMGHDVTVLTIRHDPRSPQVERRDGYTVRRFDPTVRPVGNDVSLDLARLLSRANSYDVVHAHSHLYVATVLAAVKRRFDETPLAITNHGLFSQNAPAWVFDRYLRTVGRWAFDRADVVFCYTDVDETRLRAYGVRSRVAVVPNGIDVERFTPDGPESDLVDADGEVVLFVGRLVEGKRPRVALETIDRIRTNRPNATLYVCGTGPLREGLEEHAEALGADVRFLGQVSYDEMPTLYRSADALVLPSRAEGVPRTVLEAQATGVPVVASDLAQIRPAVTDRDRLVPNGDVDGFAAALDDVLAGDPRNDESTMSSGEANRSWEETVSRTTEVLAGLTRSAPPATRR
ncbi:glycosyltransferase family 4 protein [Halovivax gelatinilyticus]|uniref:glycosyltransferase family 4 protein n=1 Tax=Halovivax gelatinilyticus TaxID=2961597 RepID=UPI0020CA5947|nr:glycosyltransferase family 4 protein [Halovivax gelatinilyticus]